MGKPVTRIREDITIPQRGSLAREDFKFPPITPRATKSPRWRLGSGFEGVSLKLSTDKRPETLRNRKVRHARGACLLQQSLPELELSATISSTRQSIRQRGTSKRQSDEGDPVETRKYEPRSEPSTADGASEHGIVHSKFKTGGKASIEQVASLTTVLRPMIDNDRARAPSPLHHNGIVKNLIQLHLSRNRELNTGQAIRKPSKSERNGWLKRRFDFAVADKDEKEHLFVHSQRTPVDTSEPVRKNGRDGLDTTFEDTAQVQHTINNDLQAFKINGGGQTGPNLERPVIDQQQDVLGDGQSPEQHWRRGAQDAQEPSSHSEEGILHEQSSDCPPEPPSSSDSEADFPSSPSDARALSMSKPGHRVQVPRTSEVLETQERLRQFHRNRSYKDEIPRSGPILLSSSSNDSRLWQILLQSCSAARFPREATTHRHAAQVSSRAGSGYDRLAADVWVAKRGTSRQGRSDH